MCPCIVRNPGRPLPCKDHMLDACNRSQQTSSFAKISHQAVPSTIPAKHSSAASTTGGHNAAPYFCPGVDTPQAVTCAGFPGSRQPLKPQCYAAFKSPPNTFFTRCRIESWLASYGCSLLGISSIAGTGCTTHACCSGYEARACSCPWQKTAYREAEEQGEVWGRYSKVERVVAQAADAQG